MKQFIKNIACASVLSACAFTSSAQANIIELALVLDESGSMGQSGFNLQVDAYESIFTNNFYDNYMVNGDTLVVSAYTFSLGVTQEISWTTIVDNASAAAFGAQFSGGWYSGGFTDTKEAVDVASFDLLNNGIDGDKMIIDISTDGNPYCPISRSNCSTTTNARQDALNAAADALANDVITNAIGIGSSVTESFLDDFTTAGGGFYKLAHNFDSFQSSLEEKLFREINGTATGTVPSPAPILLMAAGLMGIMFRRRNAK